MSGVAYKHDDAGQRTRMQSFMIVGCGLISLPQPGDRRGYILPWPYASRARSWAQRGHQGGPGVASAVHAAVDEDAGGAEDPTRAPAAVFIPRHLLRHPRPPPAPLSPHHTP